ncbi:hypothetical protein HJG60_000285 [Phyllostomus discolor]|uniref:Disintegrin and metalloproteinase domain-containing protein 20-like n=1 Tax=Phyllostomus discolor TaxID=89673 RepID=A0A833ZFT1_9CHIR|nr:hypothetical protein HJG60_000285 [Phyllostomus discolor]
MKVNNYLLSRHLQVFSYTNQGALLLEQPFIQNDCYYQGYVEGDPESMVTLCTCLGGFQGTLQTNDVVYEIEPKRHSTTFEHLIYKVDRKETQFPPMRCGLADEEIAQQLKSQETVNFTLMQSGYEGWWTHKRFLELAVVVDHNRYLHRDSNTTKVQYEVFLVVNEVDNFLSSLDVDVVLTGIEVWNARNLLPVNDISNLLVGFCRWKKNSFNNCLIHDVAHIFVKQDYGISVGLAYVGTVWNIFTVTQCGNSVVEGGKECDCGTSQLCLKDPCCQLSCTLRLGAACAFGLCCQDCQILPTGTVCRQQENTCDLPEWCNGTSNHCPEDVYVQDGFPCEDGGYCYEKRCNNREEQCRNIFGKEAKSANQSCYTKMNTRGERFGNCGIRGAEYVRCNMSDVLCGRVQCENVTEIPLLRDHSTVHWTRFNDITCWGTDYHLGMATPDIGDVKDGTECGADHVCIKRKCVHLSLLVTGCSPETCNMNGVCNNRNNCHCNLNSRMRRNCNLLSQYLELGGSS